MNRLTPERLREIEDMELPKGKAVIAIAELLDEAHALRAELAGAEERGRQRPWTPELASDMAALYEYMLDKSPRVDKFRVMFEVGQRLLVRTSTTAADAGEPTPSEGQASTASAGCPAASQPATRPGARPR